MTLVTTNEGAEESPRLRGVPIVLPVLVEEDREGMNDDTWNDLQKTIAHEAKNVTIFGEVTPRRLRKGETVQAEDNGQEPGAKTKTEVEIITVDGVGDDDLERQEVQEGRPSGKNCADLSLMNSAAIRNPRPAKSLLPQSTLKGDEEEVAEDPCHPNRKSKLLGLAALPTLRFYFEMVGREGCKPDVYLGLAALHRVAAEADHRVLWNVETDLEKRIRERQELAAEAEREKSERIKALRAEQHQELNPTQNFMDQHNRAMDDLRKDKDRDHAKIHDLEDALQRQEREEEREQKKLEQTKEIISQDKEAREQRSNDRKAKVDALLEEEEEHRDSQLAAERVRHRFDKAKEDYKASGDEGKLDQY